MDKKAILLSILKFGIAGGLIGWMIYKGLIDFSVLTKLTEPHILAIVVTIGFLIVLSNNHRWTLLLRAQKITIGNRQTLPLSLIGLFFNYAVPGGVGGDVIKGYYLLQDYPNQKVATATTVLLDRIIGMYSMVLMATLAMVVDYARFFTEPKLQLLGLSVLGLMGAMSTFFVLAFSQRLKSAVRLNSIIEKIPGSRFFQQINSAFEQFRSQPKILLDTLGFSLLSQTMMTLFIFLVVTVTATANLSLLTFFVVVPLGLITTVLPIAPGGIGVGQAAFYILFAIYHSPDPQSGANAITVYQLVLLLWGLPGIYFYLTRKRHLPQLSQ